MQSALSPRDGIPEANTQWAGSPGQRRKCKIQENSGLLQCLTYKRQDISYATKEVERDIQAPAQRSLHKLKCVLRYLRGTHAPSTMRTRWSTQSWYRAVMGQRSGRQCWTMLRPTGLQQSPSRSIWQCWMTMAKPHNCRATPRQREDGENIFFPPIEEAVQCLVNLTSHNFHRGSIGNRLLQIDACHGTTPCSQRCNNVDTLTTHTMDQGEDSRRQKEKEINNAVPGSPREPATKRRRDSEKTFNKHNGQFKVYMQSTKMCSLNHIQSI